MWSRAVEGGWVNVNEKEFRRGDGGTASAAGV